MLDMTKDIDACTGRRAFGKLLVNASILLGERVILVVDSSQKFGDERVPAGTMWFPPGKRLTVEEY